MTRNPREPSQYARWTIFTGFRLFTIFVLTSFRKYHFCPGHFESNSANISTMADTTKQFLSEFEGLGPIFWLTAECLFRCSSLLHRSFQHYAGCTSEHKQVFMTGCMDTRATWALLTSRSQLFEAVSLCERTVETRNSNVNTWFICTALCGWCHLIRDVKTTVMLNTGPHFS